MHKKSDVVIFYSLPDPMSGVFPNKDFSVNLLEDTHSGKERWGLVFYGVNYKFLAYYRLGSKDPTSSLNLDHLGNFTADHGIPRILITDSDGVLGAGKKWKYFYDRHLPPSAYLNQINTIKTRLNVPSRI